MSSDAFVYDALPMRVVFGSGALPRVADEVVALGLERVLVLSTPEQRGLADRVESVLGDRAVGVVDRARMHVPVEVVDQVEAQANAMAVDGFVAAGGGSTIGLGKALALRSGLPGVAVPTTYAGSEMTPIWGLTEAGHKQTGRDRSVLPRSVVYDPDLTHALSVATSGSSGLNAIAHAVEALYAPDGSPVSAAIAEQGIRGLASALPRIIENPRDEDARSSALQGAWLCGACLGATTMGLHHKLCHVLGGMLDLPHAETHAIVLPHVAAFNLTAAPAAQLAIQRALGDDDVPATLLAMAAAVGIPRGLRELGVAEQDLPRVVDEVAANPYSNPRPVQREALSRLLQGAWTGEL